MCAHLVKKSSRVRHANSPACTAFEYPMPDKDLNVAYIEINGRYPDTGQVTNEVVKELLFVVAGSGKLVLEGTVHELEEGDAVFILPKEKYHFEGTLKLAVSCAPAWTLEQYRAVAQSEKHSSGK